MKSRNALLLASIAALYLAGCGDTALTQEIDSSSSSSLPAPAIAAKFANGPSPVDSPGDFPATQASTASQLEVLRKGPVSDATARPLFFNSASMQVGSWLLDAQGNLASGAATGATSSNAWQIVGTGDFNGDSVADILWQNQTTRALGIWYRSNSGSITGGSLPTPSVGWDLKAVADFDGDTVPDILWQNSSTGALAYWWLAGSTIGGAQAIPANPDFAGPSWALRACADFSGDGRADLVWQDSSNGKVRIDDWTGSEYGVTSLVTGFPTGGLVTGAEDFDGDGQAEVLFQDPNTREVGFAKRSGLGYQEIAVGGVGWQSAGALAPLQPNPNRAVRPFLKAKSIGPSEISLRWEAPRGALTTTIQRSTDGIQWSDLSTVAAPGSTFTDTSVTPYGDYQYRASCQLPTSSSAFSRSVAAAADYGSGLASTSSQTVAHTGWNRDEKGGIPQRLHWTARIGTSGSLSPAVVEGERVILTTSGYFDANNAYAVSLADGSPLWTSAFGSVRGLGWPSVYDGSVAVQQSNSTPGTYLFMLNASDGTRQRWFSFNNQWSIFRSPIQISNRAYCQGGYYGGLVGFITNPSQFLFSVGLAQVDNWSPAYYRGSVYSWAGGAFKSHNLDSGAVDWSLNLPSTGFGGYQAGGDSCLADGFAYVVGSPAIYAIDLNTRTWKWVSSLNFSATPAYANGIVYGNAEENLIAHDAKTGRVLWSFRGDSSTQHYPVVAGGLVYFSTQNSVYALDAQTGVQRWSDSGGGILTVGAGHLFVSTASRDLKAYLLSRP